MQEKIESIRSNEEIGVKLMNAWEERIYDREDARKEGWEEGQKEKQDQIIAKMKQKLSDEEIVELTGIPQEEVSAVPKP